MMFEIIGVVACVWGVAVLALILTGVIKVKVVIK